MTDEPKKTPPEAEAPPAVASSHPDEADPAAPPPSIRVGSIPPPRADEGASASSESEETEEGEGEDLPDSSRFRSLLKLAVEAPPPPPKIDLLSGVQQRLRERSRGKFYADGWSTREENPRFTYLVTAIVMLALVLLAYFSLVPSGIGKLP